MTKKVRMLKKNLVTALVSLFVLLVVALPVYVTGKWIYDIAGSRDKRKVAPTVAFVPRAADLSNMPLAPFKEPIVSVTFDDGWESIYTEAFPLLQRDGFHTTQYIIAGSLEDHSYMSLAQLEAMHAAGTEIGSHTMTHQDLTTLSAKDLNWELGQSQKILSQKLGPVQAFASPLGAYNAYTINSLKKYYTSHKNAEGDPDAGPMASINLEANFDRYNLKAYSITNKTTLADLQKLLDETRRTNGWLILTYHQIDDTNQEYSVTPQAFKRQLELVSRSSLRSATVHQVLARIGDNQ